VIERLFNEVKRRSHKMAAAFRNEASCCCCSMPSSAACAFGRSACRPSSPVRLLTQLLTNYLLICVDGLAAYVKALRQVFRGPVPRHHQIGRCRLQPWRGLYIAQVIKQYAKRHVVTVKHHIVQGRRTAVQRLIAHTQGEGWINTAYIERLNATFRARFNRLVRRGCTKAVENHWQELKVIDVTVVCWY
jgi:hypothetical protein